MPIIESGPLPKIVGTGARKSGSWPGHEAEARDVYKLAKRKREPDEAWALLEQSSRDSAISRLAKVINNGRVEAFLPREDGHYEARTRKVPGENQWGLWVRFVFDDKTA